MTLRFVERQTLLTLKNQEPAEKLESAATGDTHAEGETRAEAPAQGTAPRRSLGKAMRGSSLWFLVPALVLGGGVALATSGYEPLVFDPSQYQTEEAHASELSKTVDAKKLEEKSGSSKKKKAEARAAAEKAAESSASKASKLAKATLADGNFTGYSRCTESDVFDYYLRLTITVKNGKVVNVSDVRGSATGNKGDKALDEYDSINDTYIAKAKAGVLKQLLSAGKAGKTPSGVDTVSGATYSSSSMLEAYLDALEKSAAAAGNKTTAHKKSNNKKNDAGDGDDNNSDDGDGPTPAPDPDPTPDPDTDTDDDVVINYGTGQWTAYALCKNTRTPSVYTPYYIGVTVNTLDGKVTSIENIFGDDKGVVDSNVLYDEAENSYYLKRAVQGYGISGKHPGVKTQLEALIAQGKADGTVDTITGATYSSRSILEAYRAALAQAAASVQQEDGSDADSADGGSAEGAASASGDFASAVTTTLSQSAAQSGVITTRSHGACVTGK